MIRLTYLLILLVTTPALATDYIVRVETTGYVDAEIKPDSVEPEERSLRTIETLCRIGQPFRARIIVGNETTTLSGIVKESDLPESDFRVDLKHSHVVDTGLTVPAAHGMEQKILNINSSNTTVAVVQGKPLKLGGLLASSTDTTEAGTRTTRSVIFYTITVEEHDPTADER